MKGFFRKLISFSLCTVIAGGCAAVFPDFTTHQIVSAKSPEIFASDNYEYSVNDDGTVTIESFISLPEGNIMIPSVLDGKIVSSIGNSAFKNCIGINSVSLPDTITYIGLYAFSGCSALKSVTIPGSVGIIDKCAFSDCLNLSSLNLKNGLTDISANAFSGCPELTSVFIPDSVKTIGYDAFSDCTSLKTISIPVSVTDIAGTSFNNTPWLSSQKKQFVTAGDNVLIAYNSPKPDYYSPFDLVIPDGVKHIGRGLFKQNVFLRSVKIPSSVIDIGSSAFSGCNNLSDVVISDGVKSIGNSTFYECKNLKKVTIPDSIGVIDDSSFYGCTALTEIRLPKNLKAVGIRTFAMCSNLEKVTFPEGLESIGNNAFNNCVNLRNVTLPVSLKTIGIGSFYKCEHFTSLTLPPYILSVGDSAFNECKNLYSIVITSDMTEFGNDCFCSKSSVYRKNLTIYAKKWSSAEFYASKYGIKFVEYIVPVSSVSLNKSQMTLGNGETIKLSATVSPSYAEDKSVKWRTSNSKILKVDQTGNVTAVGTGTAWITVRTSNGLERSCKFIVKNAPEKITLTKGILTIGVGEKYTIGSGVNDGAACSKRTYRTSNSQIIKMTRTDWQGEFYGVKPGVAYVTVRTYNGKESTCKVTVKAAPTSVKVSKAALTLKVGQTSSLSAIIPDNCGCAKRTFRTSNSSIIKMTKTDWTGQFKAMKSGIAWVTVRTYNGKEASCKITVKA